MHVQAQQPTLDSGIRLYVADLAAYNAGHLHGVWIDATDDVDAMREQIAAMLARSPVPNAEEYAIHDCEGFGGYSVSAHAGIDELHEVACFIDEFPDYGAELIAHFGDLDQAREAAEENYGGCYTSLAEYAQELTEETSQIPPALAHYIDYEKMGRDMELNGDVFTIAATSHEVHIFWNR